MSLREAEQDRMTFTAAAGRLAGLVPRALGWRPEEFWRSTPAELAAIFAPEADAMPPALTRHDLDRLLEHDHA